MAKIVLGDAMRHIALLGALALLSCSASGQDDDTCSRLSQFERVPVAAKVETASTRDWIEMHWVGLWMDLDNGWHLECKSSGTNASKALCSWLIENTSFEFPAALPIRMLECHGFKFPQVYGMYPWIQSVSLTPEIGEQSMLLEIALGRHKGDNEVRYSVFVGPAAEQRHPLPPLFPPNDYTGAD